MLLTNTGEMSLCEAMVLPSPIIDYELLNRSLIDSLNGIRPLISKYLKTLWSSKKLFLSRVCPACCAAKAGFISNFTTVFFYSLAIS